MIDRIRDERVVLILLAHGADPNGHGDGRGDAMDPGRRVKPVTMR